MSAYAWRISDWSSDVCSSDLSLQQRRWVAREADEADRRLEHLSLTPAGRAAFARLAPKMLAFEEELLGRLTPREQRELLKGLALLEKALGVKMAGEKEAG